MAKKTDDQALRWIREICLALPGTSEAVHYGEVVFKVGSKMFASCGAKRGPRTIVFRIGEDETAALLEADSRFTRYPYEKSALAVCAGDVDDWDQLQGFVEESYRAALQLRPKRSTRPSQPRAK